MKVLWLTNTALPEASILLSEKPSPYGGWVDGAAKGLMMAEDVELYAAFIKSGIKEDITLNGDKVTYFAVPGISFKDKAGIDDNIFFKRILERVQPDIVHIFGTEFVYTLAMVNSCGTMNIRTVISIQGLVSVYAIHYLRGLPADILRKATFRDLLRRDNLMQQRRKYEQRGRLETDAIKKTQHVIGRTGWDKACTSWINQKAEYHFCNESLRDSFYRDEWNIDGCEKHSIFVSQSYYPIKGFHFMLEAMPLILARFPDAKLYIAGENRFKTDTLKAKMKISSYGSYINSLMKKYKLEGSIEFTGTLNEKDMCDRYLKSNVFVCPSTIENSPNSLGEAMILGVPCVAADVGGVSDMLEHRKEGFVYQGDAPYMLAHYICEIFDNRELALMVSDKGKARAKKTHDREINTCNLVKIYNKIFSGE